MVGTLNSFKQNEGRFEGHDGISLYFQEWVPTTPPKGLFLITHGHGEHSDSYARFINGLSNTGYAFIAWDWRGHGRSDGKRGYASHFTDYVKDFNIFLDRVLKMPEFKDLYIILSAHSMGGLIQISGLLERSPDPRIQAQILSAPLLGLTVDVPVMKDIAARVALQLYPKLTLWNELTNEQFTRDPGVLQEYPKDALRHDKVSPGVYLGFIQAISECQNRAALIKLPTLLLLGGKDSVVSTPAAERFFRHLGSQKKQLKIFPESLHEIYNDLDRNEAFEQIREFISR